MREDTRASSPIYSLLPSEMARFDSLAELALDLRRSCDLGTDFVWKQLDPALATLERPHSEYVAEVCDWTLFVA